MACAVCQRTRQVIKAAGRKLLPMRLHIEWWWPLFGVAFWLDVGRPRHRPVIYWFWHAKYGRLFKGQ